MSLEAKKLRVVSLNDITVTYFETVFLRNVTSFNDFSLVTG
jgi:hypothetical protein